MSKSKLKKELQGFSAEQLTDLILAAYDSSKAAKEYFEFFINPDADALLEKQEAIIDKELNKSKHGRSKARTTIIKGAIKQLSDWGVGYEYVLKLTFSAIFRLTAMERFYVFPDSLDKLTAKLVADYINLAAEHNGLEAALTNIDALIRNESIGRHYYRRQIRQWADTALEPHKFKI